MPGLVCEHEVQSHEVAVAPRFGIRGRATTLGGELFKSLFCFNFLC